MNNIRRTISRLTESGFGKFGRGKASIHADSCLSTLHQLSDHLAQHFKISESSALEGVDAFTMKWNQNFPMGDTSEFQARGPINTEIKRFNKISPKNLPGTRDKACYHNTVTNARKSKGSLRMAVGFVVPEKDAQEYERSSKVVHANDIMSPKLAPMTFTHAFNVNAKGEVHDTTLGSKGTDALGPMRYYGHVVPDEVAKTFKNGDHLQNWFGQHFQGYPTGRGANAFHTGQMRRDIDHK